MKHAAKVILIFLGVLLASLAVCALSLFLVFFVIGRIFMFPVFMTDDERFDYSSGLLSELRPYLEKWTTESCSEIDLSEIRQLQYEADRSQNMLSIQCGSMETAQDESVTAVFITLQFISDWMKGVIFVPSGSVIQEGRGYTLRQIDDRFWVYNYVD